MWLCFACAKQSHDKYGTDPISHGWDVSCVMWSNLVRPEDVKSRDGQKYLDGPAYATLDELEAALEKADAEDERSIPRG